MKAKEIDYFEAVFLLNIDKNTPLRSQAIFNLQVFHASFGDEPGH